MTPEIILGPPGTGKTQVLLDICDEAITSGVRPERIGFLSFTKRAAQEAVDRAVEKFGLERSRFANFRTLHSLCYRQLGLSSGDVLERAALREFAVWAGVEITVGQRWDEGSTLGFTAGDRMLHMENLARVRCVSLEEQYNTYSDDLPWSEVRRVAEALAHYKKRRHLIDYTDMLSKWLDSSNQVHLDLLLVDEDQDLSLLQWRVVEKLAAGAQRVVLAGDDDQCIYAWAGAAVDHLVTLPGQVRVLGQSWRVPRRVQAIAQEVVGQIRSRRPKEWSPREEDGEVERLGAFEEVDPSGPDVLVLARNRYVLSEYVEPVLRREGVLYETRAGPSVPRSTLQAIMVWEHLRRGERTTVEDARRALALTSLPSRPLLGWPDDQEVGMQELQERREVRTTAVWHEALDRIPPERMSYLLACRRRGELLNKPPRVRLSTIHGAKGGQANHVVLLLEQARRTAEEGRRDLDAEARVWYVGVTRAQEKLSIVSSSSGLGWDL